MSTIKIEITLDGNETNLAALLALAVGNNTEKAKALEVKDEEVVESPKEAKAAPKRASRAKPKEEPAPEPEAEEEEENDDLTGDEAEEEEEGISIENLKELLGQKVVNNRTAIVAKLKSLGATKISDLPESGYQTLFDFMSKLK